jgi:hypothetical protein
MPYDFGHSSKHAPPFRTMSAVAARAPRTKAGFRMRTAPIRQDRPIWWGMLPQRSEFRPHASRGRGDRAQHLLRLPAVSRCFELRGNSGSSLPRRSWALRSHEHPPAGIPSSLSNRCERTRCHGTGEADQSSTPSAWAIQLLGQAIVVGTWLAGGPSLDYALWITGDF